MKSKIALIALLLSLINLATMSYAQSYKKLWQSVEEAEKKSLPQTAIKLTGDIFRKAQKEKNSPQMLKAYTVRSQYQEQITPDSFYVDLKGLETWLSETTNTIDRSILHTLIANVYGNYVQTNRWQLQRATDLSDEPSDDIREWSGNLLVNKVWSHSQAALKDSLPLLSTSTKAYDPFVVQGELSDYFNHDMYHVLIEHIVTALGNVKNNWSSDDAPLQIVQIYENAITAYKQKGNRNAVILMTLKKLNEEDTNLQALDQLIETYQAEEVIAEAYLQKANMLRSSERKAEALKVCDEAIAKYPSYKKLAEVKALKAKILAPRLSTSIDESGYPGATFKVSVNHRNVDKLTIHLHRATAEGMKTDKKEVYGEELKNISSEKITHEFQLVRSADYTNKDTVFSIPVPSEGLYYIEVVPEGVKEKDQKASPFVSTRLKVLSRVLPNKQLEMAALDAQSGLPIARATILLYKDERGEKKQVEQLITGLDGKATIAYQTSYNAYVVKAGSDSSIFPQNLYRSYYSTASKNTRLSLLTDRKVYRPGQTIYVKGVLYEQYLNDAEVLKDKERVLTLRDSNRREISKQTVRTNEFGSFATEFVLPSGGLNGAYYIETDNGSTTVYMEEYKRPTFEVKFDKLQGSYRLGDSVQVSGQVKSYSGVPLQDVEVKYTVNRALNVWPFYIASPELIASGTGTLDENGIFKITAHLQPDGRGPRPQSRYSSYVYTIEATVTNEAGETQTSQTTLNAGERSLRLNMNLADGKMVNKEEAIQAIFRVENLNSEPVAVEGTYKMYPYTIYEEEKKEESSTVAYEGTFNSNKEIDLVAWKALPSGAYKIKAQIHDSQGRLIEHEQNVVLFSTNDKRLPVFKSSWVYEQNTEFDENTPASFVFGTSLKDTYIFMDVFCGKNRIKSEVLRLSDTMKKFDIPFESKEYEEGVVVVFAFVKNGQIYQECVRLSKKQPNKKLELSWETFRDKLRPGQQEEWKLRIKDTQGSAATAELLALMYDASLDKIRENKQQLSVNYTFNWINPVWNTNYIGARWQSFSNPAFEYKATDELKQMYDAFWMYSPMALRYKFASKRGIISSNVNSAFGSSYDAMEAPMAMGMASRAADSGASLKMVEEIAIVDDFEGGDNDAAPAADLRTNFAETAFFYPQLRTNEQGEIVFSFTMPESLTRWNFRGYAHTQSMFTGTIDGVVTTSKEFMVTPNLPRFVRVGDQTSIAASIANLTEKAISGTVTLTLFDPMTDKVITTQKQKFDTKAGKTTGVNFTFTATDKYDLLGCRVIAKGGNFSDGEQHVLPVLSNKEYITEAIAMPVRGKETREFSLATLFNNNSNTATDRKLTVEFSGNPAWYAVQALPALSLPTSDNAISWATTYYANSLAAYIVDSNPKIKTVFDAWKAQGGTKETFISNLEKNQDVKNILLEESPWLMEATSEAERMKRIATLFDLNNIQNNNTGSLTKLKDLQLADGSWAWYKGMQGSRYITTYVLEAFSRLAKLTGKQLKGDAFSMQQSGFDFLHKEALSEYKALTKAAKNKNEVKGISSTTLDYLYLIVISDQRVPDKNKEACDYFINKISESITTLSLTNKARAAVVLTKVGKVGAAQQFIASLKEHTVQTDEQGTYFAFNESPYSWSGLKIPAHVAVMEAMDQVANDKKMVEEMKLWLLKQKQTQQWDSPVSTVNAVYALLHRGSNLLNNQGDVRISLGGKTIETLASGKASIPGLAYTKEVITDQATLSKAKTAVVEKRDEGIAWGAVYAQYKEDISKVSKSGKELSVDKKLYVERISGTQKELVPVTADTQLNIGDKVISRLTIRLDRAMDFVQLKDQRGACFEPIGTASGYRWGAGTGYYVAIKDASTNFFFDSLNKGVYVLEYSYRVSRTGTYESGLATIQSAYAPEYASHSGSVRVLIEK
ncbi:alpha-2-macroglobulin family protein [Bacteroides sp. 224]|uniref:alpha-2-macroglobulin family protein n=1 Tax=Bacteroides sp. 224 TaxID=2302936 RepID=UPI0013D4317D|nr:alpha-2-macroglobulin family protein [Bacteroides sp. 224]NDV65555.1 alpha-2-macroglobulin [Bacteroides sp. 224]